MFWWRCGLGSLLGLKLGWMFGGGLLMLLFWACAIVLLVLALRSRVADRPRRDSSQALDILNARYARGEIDKAEYETIRRDIGV